MVNTLQIIVFTVLFIVNMPLNSSLIMIDIMQLTNLDILPVEDIIVAIFDFKVETEPINEIFEDAGYDSSNYLLLLGSLFFIVSFGIIVYLLKKLCVRITRPMLDNWFTTRIRK